MQNCKSCAAPLRGSICAYCGTRNNIDLEQKAYAFTDIRPMYKRDCPVCHIAMQTINIGEKVPFMIERCEECYGLFFDHNELENIVESMVKGRQNINVKQLRELTENPRYVDVIVYRRCPVCNTLMHRKNYRKRSGVIMDVCVEHGIWLDPGELRQILEWVKSGGQTQQTAFERTNPQRYLGSSARPFYSHRLSTQEKGFDVLDIFGALLRW